MKSLFGCLLAIIVFQVSACAQAENNSITKAEQILKQNGGNVSGILVDKQFIDLHPETAFRKLIEKNASAVPLSIAPADEPGRKIKVIVTVKDQNAKPVPGVMVYLYQTDSKGWYAADQPHVGGSGGDVGHARLFGYVKTNTEGKFELFTVKPSGYPQSDLPAHIHIHFSAPGYENYRTELLFDDDDRLVGQIRANSIRFGYLISKPEKATAPAEQQFSYSITMHKRN